MATSHYFVGGGAVHTAEMVRRDAYATLGGAEGLAEVGDLKVLPLNVPGGGVRVVIGSAYMRSRYAGAVREMYMGSVVTEETVSIPPTPSDKGRTDLIVMRVKDPYVQGSPWPDPGAGFDAVTAHDERANAQYVFVEAITVPAGTTRLQDVPGHEYDTAVTLGRVTLPASTGTVTTTHIVDLRKVARPRSHRVVRAINLTESGTGDKVPITATTAYPTGGQTWPVEAETAGHLDIDIPEWATHIVYSMTWSQMSVLGSDPEGYGYAWLQIGANVDPDVWRGQATAWDTVEKGGSHTMMMRVADTASVKQQFRGKRKRFYPRVTRNSPAPKTGSPRLTWATSWDLDVTFEERAV